MKIAIGLPAETVSALDALTANLNLTPSERTLLGERMTRNKLIMLVLNCTAMAQTRPGSWEGAGVLDLFRKHGYEL